MVKEGKHLAKKFMEILNGAEMYSPIPNVSLFTLGGGYSTAQYFSKEVKSNIPPYHAIIVSHKNESALFVAADSITYLGKIGFKEYLKGNLSRDKTFYTFPPQIEKIYEKYTTEEIETLSYEDMCKVANKIFSLIWQANAWSHFTIHFDQETAKEILQELNISISQEKIEEIFTKATIMVSPSFHIQQHIDVYTQLSTGATLKEISKHSRYILANYSKVPTEEEVLHHLEEHFKNITSKEAKEKILEIEKEFAQKKEEFTKWVQTLGKVEQQIANYCQLVMKLRDDRKNFFNKGLTTARRIVERVLHDANIPLELSRYVNVTQELPQGIEFLKSIQGEFKKRREGFTYFIPSVGEKEIEYDSSEEDFIFLREEFKKQHAQVEIIKGSPACKGK